MDPTGKLFYTKSEEVNGCLGDIKSSLQKGVEVHQEMSRQ